MRADLVPGILLLWPVVGTLLAAALCAVLRHRPDWQRATMEAATGLMLAASLGLLAEVSQNGPLTVGFGGWPRSFGVSFTADRLGAMLSVFTGIVGLVVAIYARADIGPRRRASGFDALFLAMLAAVNGAFLTGDLFNLYVWFELMLVTALGLTVLDRRRAQIDGAIRYAALSMLGAAFMLLGIALLFGEAGTLNMADLSRALNGRAPSLALVASAFLLLSGFGLKAGLFPFFSWLPAAYPTAPMTVLAGMAGLLTKVGFYACLRVLVLVFGLGTAPVIPGLAPMLGLLAAATMVLGVLGAMAQEDTRRILAFQIVASIGTMMMGLALASLAGLAAAILYMLHSILVTTSLFFAAGAIARANGSTDLNRCGGLMKRQPMLAVYFAVPALSLAGIPPFSGFWGKFVLAQAGFLSGGALLALVLLATGFVTVYSMSQIWVEAFWKAPGSGRAPRRVPPAMLAAMGILAFLILAMGIGVEPLSAFAREAARGMVPGAAPAGGGA
ncbi:Sodium/proton antiporter protein shaD [Roseomonas mucosa]|uniref:Sodium/proton antiporter protein shaD n=1 Tax=Roseomonas mucosa TaxID=207340 RepID=A0A4Y1MTQ6_9PROT|nr:proton-conducting transporter membrane subunit [Roseomonas mucosa]AWV21060.1 Sodium/proton antiporter protein shaD [Roseomonas mucosa]MDT8278256.1 proton-conducting transporter membrane subunit [Roseomonas mucosa]MDT8352765.1 proton-conducting transporter membrane subunit [Roseomonas mucosa]MDU7520836.1 proton-conducting transporter membrane subunit [Roseomonas mucosa]